MSNNYIIVASGTGDIFGGWDKLGNMVMKKASDRAYAYRMQKTVADKNVEKVEKFSGQKCLVEEME